MIGQTLAIFVDAYRELNAKKMFWVVLSLSGLVVVVFAAVGVRDGQMVVLGFETPVPMPFSPERFYRYMFVNLGVAFWLTFAATVLAIISTASVFPDFITGGSIDLYLSKPISRLRLFVTKLLTGLLFVALQVFVFVAASFVVIGLRGGVWEPKIFLAVPLVLCFFSYLYGFLVLFGVLTRSTLAAVLLTVLAWCLLVGLDQGERITLIGIHAGEREAVAREKRIAWLDGRLAYFEKQSPDAQAGSENIIENFRLQRDDLLAERGSTSLRNIRVGHRIAYTIKTLLPKTRETIDVMNRRLLKGFEREQLEEEDGGDEPPDISSPRTRRRVIFQPARREVREAMRARSLSWVIGTSLAFEAVVLAAAAWVFVRRDY